MRAQIEDAYKGAQLAYQLCEPVEWAKGLNDCVVKYLESGGFKVVDLLLETCREAVLEHQAMTLRPQVEQAAIWKALGILETAALMPEFWEQGLIEAAYEMSNKPDRAEPDEFERLLNGLVE